MTINARASQLSSGSGVGPAARRPATAPSGAWESRPAFLFTGHGSQYKGMAEGLFEAHPVFREAIERCDGILGEELKPGLLDVLYGSPEARSLIHQSAYANPAFFAGIELLRIGRQCVDVRASNGQRDAKWIPSLGPDGEYCDIIAAGLAPFPDGMSRRTGPRSMRLQSEARGKAFVPCGSTLPQAFHSPMGWTAILGRASRSQRGSVRFKRPRPESPYVSALTGSLAYLDEVRQAGYWVEHFSREPVRSGFWMQCTSPRSTSSRPAMAICFHFGTL